MNTSAAVPGRKPKKANVFAIFVANILKIQVTDEDFDLKVGIVVFLIAVVSALLSFISLLRGEERAVFFLMGAIPFAGFCTPFAAVGLHLLLVSEWEKAEKEAIS